MGEVTEVTEGAGDEMPATLVSMYSRGKQTIGKKVWNNKMQSIYAKSFINKHLKKCFKAGKCHKLDTFEISSYI